MRESQKTLHGNKCVPGENGSQKEEKSIIQVPIEYVLVREYLEIKSVEKASFVNSSGKQLHF